MADKLTELKTALEEMSDEEIELVLEFAKYLAKIQSDLEEKSG